MIKLIPTTYGEISEDMIDEEVSKIDDKCQLIGNAINYKRELLKDNGCFANLEIIVKNNDNYYKFEASGLGNEECTIDSVYEIFGRKVNIGEKLYILSDKDNRIISYRDFWYKKYKENLCKSNYSEKQYILEYGNFYEKAKIYGEQYFIYGLLILIIVSLVIILKKRKKTKK